MSALQDCYAAIWDGQLACYDSEVITIEGHDYACAGGQLTEGSSVDYGGIIEEPSCVVGIRRALLLEFLADTILITADTDESTSDMVGLLARINCTYRGKPMKIIKRRSTPDNVIIMLDLEPRLKGGK